jgi:hypothetical protein
MPDLPGDVERGILAALLLDERDQTDAATELAQFQNRFELKRRLRRLREATRAIAEEQAAGGASIEGVQTELLALQRAGEQARELTLGGSAQARQPARPSGPQGVQTNG